MTAQIHEALVGIRLPWPRRPRRAAAQSTATCTSTGGSYGDLKDRPGQVNGMIARWCRHGLEGGPWWQACVPWSWPDAPQQWQDLWLSPRTSPI